MDLPNFQLADTMDELSVLRNLSESQSSYSLQQQQQQQHQHQQQINNSSPATTTPNNRSSFNRFHGNIDILFQQNSNGSPHINSYLPINPNSGSKNSSQIPHDMSPHYQAISSSTPQNDYFDQEDILTPLISPAMTPSHNYQMHHHQQKNHQLGSDINFSPLSSPAILPHGSHNRYHPQKHILEEMSASQICEQYEQLEQAKLAITQKLTELQKSQHQQQPYSFNSNVTYQHKEMPSNDLLPKRNNHSYPDHQDHNQPQHQEIDASSFLNSEHISLQTKADHIYHVEPATPASLMNMKQSRLIKSIGNKSNSYETATTYNDTSFHSLPIQPGSISSTTTTTTTTTTSSTSNSNLKPKGKERSSLGPSRSRGPLKTYKQPLNNPSPISKKPRRESQESKTSHISPRALKPLLISPTLNPGPRQPVPALNINNNGDMSSIEDAERILATRSNYQNLMEGKAAALGIAFSSQIKSGLEVRRTAHKAAEQKRRDSLKEWFDRLRREVEEGYVKRQSSLMSRVIRAQELEKKSTNITRKRANSVTSDDGTFEEENTADPSAIKPLSKVLLLQYAYEYISSLKETLAEKDNIIEQLKREHEENNDNDEDGKEDYKVNDEVEEENAS